MPITDPIDEQRTSTAPRLAIAPSFKDPETGALFVHEDLRLSLDPWEAEGHISPPKGTHKFGDIASWVAYVQKYGNPGSLLTWNAQGLSAVLDHHTAADSGVAPGRCQWTALHPFERSLEWQAWTRLASGQPVSQKFAVEQLEDLAADIVEPASADLVNLLRSLRSTVNHSASAELRPDGSASVSFTKDTTVRAGGNLEVALPGQFKIAIPVLKGHLDDEGRPVLYQLVVKLRVGQDDNAHLTFKFTIPTAERTLEAVYADRVKSAKQLLGDGFALLRAA